ncbi:chromate efflux transporter [Halocynthiibacter styelae]|uniref:Chromate efflux transporter n=1 Tax=Halocynthiibacter styelae TaxID=2761955 RepID=A0A8J7LKK5_9RHOB|nr:chromate efflux transporter [Paenihalocynthiibacter styelae]MBI1494195.1 chromate efflux transporter [Paenihalocynthiibacter styelae]
MKNITIPPAPDLAELFRVFGRIGILSFGGPAAQIALMHRELVEERPWLSEESFLNALSFCMMLPGPEAMQLATWAGWKQRGIMGGLIAGGLFVLPGAFMILALALLYAQLGDLPLIQSLFFGIKAAVVIIVLEALFKVSKKAFGGKSAVPASHSRVIAVLSFIGIFALQLPFPVIILAAGLWGAMIARSDETPTISSATPSLRNTALTFLIGTAIWAVPFAVVLFSPHTEFLTTSGLFFSKLAVVTFGGAYAVLAWMTQEVVTVQGWLTTPEMLDALGLAETTPGPLILVTEFVGTLAAWKEGGIGLALINTALTLWVTFVPCFIWIFAGAPWIDRLMAQPRLRAGLQAITAAVVGVIANLSIWFALHVFFVDVTTWQKGIFALPLPVLSSLNLTAFLLALLAAWLLIRRKWNLLYVLGLMALAGGLTQFF